MRNLKTYFNKSQTLNEFIKEIQVKKGNLISIYNFFPLSLNDARLNQLRESNYSKVLIIKE
ncbi:thioredoxin family protein, partial [Staphylococcus epidermidis]